MERTTPHGPLTGKCRGSWSWEVYVLGLSIWKILIIVGLIVLLFGRGKVSALMGDLAKGIKSFKRGMAEDDDDPKVIDQKTAETATAEDKARS